MTIRPVLFALVLLPAAALAQSYRWVDAQGQVHYSQTPPPKGVAGTYVPPPPPPSASPNQDAINKSLSDSTRAEPAKQREASHAAEERALKDAQCRNTLNDLANLNSQTSNRLRITEEAYQQRHKELEAFIAQNCK